MTTCFQVTSLTLGQLQANCYLVTCCKTKKTLIIDPGDAPEYIVKVIIEKELKPELILATHGHFDHLMGATYLKLTLDIPLALHQKDEFLLKSIRTSAKHFLGMEADPPSKVDFYPEDKSEILIGAGKLRVLETSGHTPGSICLYYRQDALLFCGDLLFKGGGVGRTDFSYSDENKLRASLVKIMALPDRTVVYPGHGELTTISSERKNLKNYLNSF